MWLLFVEAVFALCILVFIVWWTMFSGRKPDHPPVKESLPLEDETEKDE